MLIQHLHDIPPDAPLESSLQQTQPKESPARVLYTAGHFMNDQLNTEA